MTPSAAAAPPAPTLPAWRRRLVFLQVTLATVLGFAATDLVLPAIPGLPAALGGTPAQAQYVLAAYTAGFAGGLLLFGELGARWPQRPLLAGALVLFAATSLLAARAPGLPALVALRVLQGVSIAAGAAFAPGVLRRVFQGPQAVRAIGLQGSIEALAPAGAPIVGAWLLAAFGWRSSFVLVGVLALAVALSMAALPATVFPPADPAREGGYLRLLRRRGLLREGLGQALSLAGLLVTVFSAPAVLVGVWGAPLSDFIRMQVVGVATFIVAVQAGGPLCRRWGETRVVAGGSVLSALGCLAILGFAWTGSRDTLVLTALWVVVNAGFGLRGPAGFMRAIAAADGDDSRAAALVILAMLGFAALGTALVAPFITLGLLPVAAVAALLSCGSVVALWLLR